MKATFNNFVAFGQRASVDLRVIITHNTHVGIPLQFHVGLECENTGGSMDTMASFAKLASDAFAELRDKLNQSGHAGLAELVDSTFVDEICTHGVKQELSHEFYFATWTAFIFNLNTMEFIYEVPSE